LEIFYHFKLDSDGIESKAVDVESTWDRRRLHPRKFPISN